MPLYASIRTLKGVGEKRAALYEKLGFRQVGCRPNYYRHPKEDGLILRKEWEV